MAFSALTGLIGGMPGRHSSHALDLGVLVVKVATNSLYMTFTDELNRERTRMDNWKARRDTMHKLHCGGARCKYAHKLILTCFTLTVEYFIGT